MKTFETRRLCLALVAIVIAGMASIAPAHAQGQGSSRDPHHDLSRIQGRLRTGDRLHVTSKTGEVLAVRLESVDVARDLLLVSLNGIPLDLPASGIRTIEVSRRDPLTNGAWIGAAHGLGITLLMVAISDDDTALREFVGFSLLTVPLGAGIGAAIDAAHWQRELVYRDGFPGVWGKSGSIQATPAGRFAFSLRVVW